MKHSLFICTHQVLFFRRVDNNETHRIICHTFKVLSATITALTLESVAQSRQSVDPWRTTRLSSGAPGSPAGRGQTEADVFMQQMGHKVRSDRVVDWRRGGPKGKNTSLCSITPPPPQWGWKQPKATVTTLDRLHPEDLTSFTEHFLWPL